jgi:hypothetical protein
MANTFTAGWGLTGKLDQIPDRDVTDEHVSRLRSAVETQPDAEDLLDALGLTG